VPARGVFGKKIRSPAVARDLLIHSSYELDPAAPQAPPRVRPNKKENAMSPFSSAAAGGPDKAIGQLLDQAARALRADSSLLAGELPDPEDGFETLGDALLELTQEAAAALSEPAGLPLAAFFAGLAHGAIAGEGETAGEADFELPEADAAPGAVSRAAQTVFARLQAVVGETYGEGRGALLGDEELWAFCQRGQSAFLARRPLALCSALGFVQGVLSAQNRLDAVAEIERSAEAIARASGFAPSPRAARAPAIPAKPAMAPVDVEREEAPAETSAAVEPQPSPAEDGSDRAHSASEPGDEAFASADVHVGLIREPEPVVVAAKAFVVGHAETLADAPLAAAAAATQPDADSPAAALASTEAASPMPDDAADADTIDAGEPAARSPRPKREARPRGPTRPPRSRKPKAARAAEASADSPAVRVERMSVESLRRGRKDRERSSAPAPQAHPDDSAIETRASAPEPSEAALAASLPSKPHHPKRLSGRAAAKARKGEPPAGL
jgi:hypothetical protein